MDALYPEIEPFQTGFLNVSDLHTLYYEECGNPAGKPVVFLHGGPGAGINAAARRFFDPHFYHIVLFDQRGAGKSTPYAGLEENSSWDLVADMERLRHHLGIDRWLVFGGSWGSTLALLYAIRHPEPVVGLVLRGIYLGRRWENEWLFQGGASHFFPDHWQPYIDFIPAAERGDLIAAYRTRLTSPDLSTRLLAARYWATWENSISRLIPETHPAPTSQEDEANLAIARLENHYIYHRLFLPDDNYLLESAPAIRHIPTRIVHGRYDLICPVRSAFELAERLPQAELRVIPDTGHTSLEPGNAAALVQATRDFQHLF